MNEKLNKVLNAIQEKKRINKDKKDAILAKYSNKKLSIEERVKRIEELLGIE